MSATQNTFQLCLDEYGGGGGAGGALQYYNSYVLVGSELTIPLSFPGTFPRGIYLYINDYVSTNVQDADINISINNGVQFSPACSIPTSAGTASDVNATILRVAVDGYLITGQSLSSTRTVFDVDIDPAPTEIVITAQFGNLQSGTVHIFYA